MTKWLEGIRGALAMPLIWAAGWFGVGMAIELIYEFVPDWWFGRAVDIWPFTLAIPAFVAGVIFSAILSMAERGRRLDEVSLPRAAIWGAASGLLLGVLVVITGVVGSPSPEFWPRAARNFSILMLLGAGSALLIRLSVGLLVRGTIPHAR